MDKTINRVGSPGIPRVFARHEIDRDRRHTSVFSLEMFGSRSQVGTYVMSKVYTTHVYNMFGDVAMQISQMNEKLRFWFCTM